MSHTIVMGVNATDMSLVYFKSGLNTLAAAAAAATPAANTISSHKESAVNLLICGNHAEL